jgi:hypothetical protein
MAAPLIVSSQQAFRSQLFLYVRVALGAAVSRLLLLSSFLYDTTCCVHQGEAASTLEGSDNTISPTVQTKDIGRP